jgi:hypothetical protein
VVGRRRWRPAISHGIGCRRPGIRRQHRVSSPGS